MNNVQSTSLDAFFAIQKSLGRAQKEVLEVIRSQPSVTNAEIAYLLKNRPINRITPRTLELRKCGLVEKAGKRTCRVTKQTAIAWRAKPMPSAFPPAFKPVEQKQQTLL